MNAELPRFRIRTAPRISLAAICLLMIFGTGTASSAPAGRSPAIDRAIEYHGGAVYRTSVTELEVCSKSGCSRIRAEVDGDLFDYRVTGPVRGGERTVHWTNQRLEVWQQGNPIDVKPEEGQIFKDWAMARLYFCFLPYRLDDASVLKEELGLEEWNGRTLQKVRVTFVADSSTDANDQYMYWLDPESGQVELFAYSYEGNPGGLRFRRAVNHRRVGGLLFFDQENLGAEGDDLRVDHIDPEFVQDKMRPVSMIELKNITVRPIDAP